MSKLLYANLLRLKKDVSFWLCMAFMFVSGVFIALVTTSDFPLERSFFFFPLIVGLVIAVFCGLFIGVEHSDGTMRNKLIVGHTRTAVYLANAIVCLIAGLAFCVAFMAPMFAVGVPRLGWFEMKPPAYMTLIGISLVLTAAFVGIYTLIAMTCHSKKAVAVLCILCFIALICVSAWIQSSLQQPEFRTGYSMSVNGIDQMNSEPNPDYISGAKRDIYQFICDFLPTGQALQFTELSMIHTWQLPVYSLIIFLLSTAAGLAIFRKKDIM